MKHFIFLSVCFFSFTVSAHAHWGHVGELAGHAHWIGVGAIVVSGILAGVLGLSKGQENDEVEEAEVDAVEGEAT